MRKLLHLHLFLISWLGFSQNAAELPRIEQFQSFLQSNSSRIITPAGNSFSDEVDFKWMQDQVTAFKAAPVQDDGISSDFNTFLLQEQLASLNTTTPFQVTHNAVVERYIRVFLRSRKDIMGRLMDRARYYFPIFEAHLDKYDLPLELKYLAVIESALIPRSKSRTGARGLWQFTLATGKQYGLEINSLVDERYDPIKSTDAACRFLKRLYEIFGNWDLVLAAYNAGPGNVSKAIRRAGGNTNYWEIRKYLPAETRGYLPAFYATFYLFNYSAFHRITPAKTSLSFFETDTLRLKKSFSFRQLSHATGLKIDLLKMLNPQYKTDILPASSKKSYHLMLPKHKIADFLIFEEKIRSETRQTGSILKITPENSYCVQKHDNLARIASKFNISIAQLKKWNGLETNYLIEGQHLVITDKKTAVNPLMKELPIKQSDIVTTDNTPSESLPVLKSE